MRALTKAVITIVAIMFASHSSAGEQQKKPAEKSSVAIKRIMDDLFNNDIPLPWCKKHEMLKVSLYTPLKYELRGKVKEDGEYLPKDNEYTVGYTVRMWTTNQGGIPIIQDRYVILRTQKAEKGETEWCVAMM